MLPFARIKAGENPAVDLRPGDIIGRSERAALWLSEPHISEAHALVSLRSGTLKLLALRGRFSVEKKPQSSVTLHPGQRIVLASRTPLLVMDVVLPSEVIALEDDDGHRHVIDSVSSLCVGAPDAGMVSGFVPEADAVFWTTGTRAFARVGDGPSRELVIGDTLTIAHAHYRVVSAPWTGVSLAPTQEGTEVGAPLHLILNFDTVHIIAGANRVTLDGIASRIVCELAASGVPMSWQEVAAEVWGRDVMNEPWLRQRWDSSLARIRRRLREARLRTSLIHSTRVGHVELLLTPGDTVEDRM